MTEQNIPDSALKILCQTTILLTKIQQKNNPYPRIDDFAPICLLRLIKAYIAGSGKGMLDGLLAEIIWEDQREKDVQKA
jgi:hypothetical protein